MFARHRQDEVFKAQLGLAVELQRPASVHCRRAWGRMLEIIDQMRIVIPDEVKKAQQILAQRDRFLAQAQ